MICMVYKVKNYENLFGLNGFSEILLKNHFTLYEGYVNNVNKLFDLQKLLLNEEKLLTPEYAELKRRFGWEFNGMRLHELYFENLTKEKKLLDKENKLSQQIIVDFGSLENWEKDWRAVGAMRGIGWVILSFDPITKRLFNVWIGEHDVGHLVGCIPLLVMDVFEHAYITDYGIKRADYLNSFVSAIDWTVVSSRFE